MKGKEGDWIGLEVDIARKLADDMGVKPTFISTQWSGLIPSLLSGKFDIIIAGMVITSERNKKVNFTDPYYSYRGLILAANRVLAAGFDEISDFNSPDITVSTITGTTEYKELKKVLPKANITTYDTNAQLVQAVLSGHSHALAQVDPTPMLTILRHPDDLFIPFTESATPDKFAAFAVAKGDHDSLNFLNHWIRLRTKDGWIGERKMYWFESIEWMPLLP